MACETNKYVGRVVMLRYAIGCGDTRPSAGDWKKIGGLRAKEFSLSWDTTDATDSDSIGALRDNLATFQNLTISGDGVLKNDLTSNLTELTKHFINPVETSGQPVIWLEMTFPDLTFIAFMLLTTLSRSAPYDDVSTYTLEASATSSDFGLIVEDTPALVSSVVVAPTTASISTPDGTVQLTATALPAEAAQTVTWSSSAPSIATVDATGLVTAVADGTATITATSTADNTKSASSVVTITNQ